MTAKSWCILFWVTVFTIPTVQAEKEWTWDPAFRYRTQSVGDEFLGDAVASTFKGRLTTQYLLDQAWSVKASIDHVHVFNEGRYNNIVVHRPTSPIPDPPGTELSELSVLYRLNSEWALWEGGYRLFTTTSAMLELKSFGKNDRPLTEFNCNMILH